MMLEQHIEELRAELRNAVNDSASARETLAQYLDDHAKPPHVLIAGNNPLLLGAMGLLKDRGIQVPGDMAVVAYDEFAWSTLTDPSITVLNEDSEEIGRRAAVMLREIIDGQEAAGRKGQSQSPVYVPEHRQQVSARLMLRRSCGCLESGRETAKGSSFQAA